MKTQEFRKLIREEARKVLKEVTSYPINITEIRPIAFNRAYIQVGNSSADMVGWEHDANDVKKIESILKEKLSATIKRLPSKPSGEPDQPISATEAKGGSLYFLAYGSFTGTELMNAMQAIKALNIKYQY